MFEAAVERVRSYGWAEQPGPWAIEVGGGGQWLKKEIARRNDEAQKAAARGAQYARRSSSQT